MKTKHNNRKDSRKDNIIPLTDWIEDETILLERIEKALSELEAEEYLRWVNDVFPMTADYRRSIPIEKVSEKSGVSVKRILDLIVVHRNKLKFKRIKCKTRSRYGWCLRHDDYNYGVSIVEPRLVDLVSELMTIKRRLRNCLNGPVILILDGKIHTYRRVECGLTKNDIIRLITRAAIIADELGINEEKLKEWLGLEKDNIVFYLDNGEKVELMAEKY